jgi:hypothetical protein
MASLAAVWILAGATLCTAAGIAGTWKAVACNWFASAASNAPAPGIASAALWGVVPERPLGTS